MSELGTTMGVVGIAAGALAPFALWWLLGAVTVSVDEGSAVLVLVAGRLRRVLTRPGLHLVAARLLPWVSTRAVSMRRDFRVLHDLHVNDARGTTVLVDLWMEYRVVDPARALFEVSHWERALTDLVAHAATELLSNRDFDEILHERRALGERLAESLRAETDRWGVALESVMLSRVGVLPDVARQLSGSVAAKLDRARATVDERGRLAAARLEADTGARIAQLVAEAKGQYPALVGEALGELPETVRAAYLTLHELAQLRPHRTVAFRGFEGEALRATDAAMLLGDPHKPVPLNGTGPTAH